MISRENKTLIWTVFSCIHFSRRSFSDASMISFCFFNSIAWLKQGLPYSQMEEYEKKQKKNMCLMVI